MRVMTPFVQKVSACGNRPKAISSRASAAITPNCRFILLGPTAPTIENPDPGTPDKR